MTPRFSRRIAWPAHSNDLARLLAARRASGLPVLNFAESNPTQVGLARDAAAILAPLSRTEALSYAPESRGLRSAREALAHFASGRAGGRCVDPEQLVLCASTSEAYGWLFKLLCDPGDAVLVPKPGYPLFEYLAGLECVETRPYRLEYLHPRGWVIDVDAVKTAFEDGHEGGRIRAIILINPNNPTGSYVGAHERQALIELAARYGAAIIADEVFYGFPVEGAKAASFGGEEGVLTFTLDGLSKLLGLPQMKLGWIRASGPRAELEEALSRLEIIADSYLSASTPIQLALPSYLALVPEFQAVLGDRLKRNLLALRDLLEYPGSPHRVLRCEGGWTALLEAPRLFPEEALAHGLLADEGLLTQPGYFFDMEREAYFTASLILEPERLAEAALRYRSYFERLLAG